MCTNKNITSRALQMKKLIYLGIPFLLSVFLFYTNYDSIHPVEVFSIDLPPKVSSVELVKRHTTEQICLAQNAYMEARGEGEVGMVGVINVTQTRAKSTNRSNCDEVFRPYQFSWTLDSSLVISDMKSYQLALHLAKRAIDGDLEDVTGGSDHYLNPAKLKTLPSWYHKYQLVKIIRNHHYLKGHYVKLPTSTIPSNHASTSI